MPANFPVGRRDSSRSPPGSERQHQGPDGPGSWRHHPDHSGGRYGYGRREQEYTADMYDNENYADDYQDRDTRQYDDREPYGSSRNNQTYGDGYGYDRRHRRSTSPHDVPAGNPSDTVILEGLPLGMTVEEVSSAHGAAHT